MNQCLEQPPIQGDTVSGCDLVAELRGASINCQTSGLDPALNLATRTQADSRQVFLDTLRWADWCLGVSGFDGCSPFCRVLRAQNAIVHIRRKSIIADEHVATIVVYHRSWQILAFKVQFNIQAIYVPQCGQCR